MEHVPLTGLLSLPADACLTLVQVILALWQTAMLALTRVRFKVVKEIKDDDSGNVD